MEVVLSIQYSKQVMIMSQIVVVVLKQWEVVGVQIDGEGGSVRFAEGEDAGHEEKRAVRDVSKICELQLVEDE